MIEGPFQLEEDGDYLWITGKHGFALARIQWRFPNAIAEFTPADCREHAAFMLVAMNDKWETQHRQLSGDELWEYGR